MKRYNVLAILSDLKRAKACMEFCRGVPTEELQQGLGVFVEAKMEFNERPITPTIANAIELLKRKRL